MSRSGGPLCDRSGVSLTREEVSSQVITQNDHVFIASVPIGDNINPIFTLFRNDTATANQFRQRPVARPRGPMTSLVLVVDDDPVQRRLLEAMIRRFGYDVETAAGG